MTFSLPLMCPQCLPSPIWQKNLMSFAVVVAYFREVINPSQEIIYAKEGKGLGRQLPPQPCVHTYEIAISISNAHFIKGREV